MLFHTQAFLTFFVVVFALHWASPTASLRHAVLFFASITFYMFWSVPLVSLLLASTAIDFYAGQRAWETQDKRWPLLSVVTNLGVLAFFKYANFSVHTFVSLADAIGWQVSLPAVNIVLPLGVSFYTFQSMSYTIDMYRRQYEPYQSLLDFALYISFFPQLIAGPIVRANYFRKQLYRKLPLRWLLVNQGISLFVIGAFKKIVLADQAAVFANAVFGAPAEYTCVVAAAGVVGFAFQIYFDFSAYTDMARGLGYLLGYELPENFLHPYGALGIRDFWRKWHLSLSSWLRDYLYISLGGSRHGAWKTKRNLMLTMLLGGLWHGAGWNFVIWGGIHGLCLSIEDLLFKHRPLRQPSWWANVLIGLMTFIIVCFSWVFFRAQTFEEATGVLKALGTIPTGSLGHQIGYFNSQNWLLGIILPAILVVTGAIHPLDKTLRRYPTVVSASAMAAMISVCAVVVGGTNEFIYFQF